jgi:hypothetical protein
VIDGGKLVQITPRASHGTCPGCRRRS